MNRFLSILIVIIMIALCVFSVAADGFDLPIIPIDELEPEPESVWNYSVSGGTVTITGYTGTRSYVMIPSVLGSNSVTALGARVFYNKRSITYVSIPSSVNVIGNAAFGKCTKLTTVEVPNGVTALGESVFVDCAKLKNVSLPASLETIGTSAFSNCTSLETITLPSSLTSLGVGAFGNCSALSTVTIPESVSSIADGAFAGCTALSTVYYGGTALTWGRVSIGVDNDPLNNADIIFRGQGAPTDVSGDVDGDGSLNAADVIALMRYLVGYNVAGFYADNADYNNDGRINNRDILCMMLAIVNQG